MACKQRPSFTAEAVTPVVISGISPPFGRLSQARGQVTYVLLTRAPLYSGSCPPFLARLACVRHAASVRSEPGSNSPVESWSANLHEGRAGVSRRTAIDASDLASTTSRAVRSITLGNLFRAENLLGKGALLFSFQRPGVSAGRPSLIREGLRIVKAAKPLSDRRAQAEGGATSLDYQACVKGSVHEVEVRIAQISRTQQFASN